jgi:hypothetical protein
MPPRKYCTRPAISLNKYYQPKLTECAKPIMYVAPLFYCFPQRCLKVKSQKIRDSTAISYQVPWSLRSFVGTPLRSGRSWHSRRRRWRLAGRRVDQGRSRTPARRCRMAAATLVCCTRHRQAFNWTDVLIMTTISTYSPISIKFKIHLFITFIQRVWYIP